MPYFPTTQQMVYQCQGCGRWFRSTGSACCVLHPPGTCCHHLEIEHPPPRRMMSTRETAATLSDRDEWRERWL